MKAENLAFILFLLSEVHGHDDVDEIIVAHWFDDAGFHGGGSFQSDLGGVDDAENVVHIFDVKGDLDGLAIYAGIDLGYIVAGFGAGGGDDGMAGQNFISWLNADAGGVTGFTGEDFGCFTRFAEFGGAHDSACAVPGGDNGGVVGKVAINKL